MKKRMLCLLTALCLCFGITSCGTSQSQNETKASKQVKLGDVITIRGKGRFVVKEFSGSTRSGRTVVKIEKYV